jgi:hypothetical protein
VSNCRSGGASKSAAAAADADDDAAAVADAEATRLGLDELDFDLEDDEPMRFTNLDQVEIDQGSKNGAIGGRKRRRMKGREEQLCELPTSSTESSRRGKSGESIGGDDGGGG